MNQIQKLIWDHCNIFGTLTVTVAWLDCIAIKHSKAILPIECVIYTLCTMVCLVCLIHTAPDHFLLDHILCAFAISKMIPLALLLVWEHCESMKADMRNMVTGKYKNDLLTAHNHFKTRNRSTVTAEVNLPPFSFTFPPPPHLSLPPTSWWSVQGSRGEAESEWYTYYSLSPPILFSRWLTGPVWPNLGGKWL